jgi:ABC-type multidrug transport system fused ATPase/permease subunit
MDTFVVKDSGHNSEKLIPEVKANAFSKWTFSWLNQLLSTGSKRPLQMNDVWKLSADLTSDECSETLEKAWKAEQELSITQNREPLLNNALKAIYWKPLVIAGLIRLFGGVSNLFSPFLIKFLIVFVNSRGEQPLSVGIGLAIGLFVLSVVNTITENQSWLLLAKLQVRARAALITLLYKKATKLSASARQSFDSGKITSLVSTDVNRVEMFILMANNLWVAPILLIIVIGFLIYSLGYIFLN